VTTFATETEAFYPIRLREGEFEALVPRFVQRLSERWLWADWKPLLDGPAGRVRPDIALISKDCSRWCVVEVELASHPESHFRGQFEALEAAYYDTHLLRGLSAAFPSLAPSDIERLLREEPPTLLCVADDLSESLRIACRDFGFELAVGTPYRSGSGSYAIEWRRVPSSLMEKRGPSGVEYLLRLAPERLGGRQRGTLPRGFPNIKDFSLRVGQTMYPTRVFDLTTARAIYLPKGAVQVQGRPLVIRPIDPAQALYELLNGEVLG